MGALKTLRFKELAKQQTVIREPVIVGDCSFVNRDECRDAYLRLWHEPAANEDAGAGESIMDICVPAGAEVKISKLFAECPLGLYLEVSDHPSGDFGAVVGPIEARFRVMIDRPGSLADLISRANGKGRTGNAPQG